VKIRHFFLAAALAFLASTSLGYVREFDNGIPLAWVKDRTVVIQLSLATGTRILRDGFTSFNDSAIDALKTWNPRLAHLQFSWVKNSPVTPGTMKCRSHSITKFSAAIWQRHIGGDGARLSQR